MGLTHGRSLRVSIGVLEITKPDAKFIDITRNERPFMS
jgi:hypothetical protein